VTLLVLLAVAAATARSTIKITFVTRACALDLVIDKSVVCEVYH